MKVLSRSPNPRRSRAKDERSKSSKSKGGGRKKRKRGESDDEESEGWGVWLGDEMDTENDANNTSGPPREGVRRSTRLSQRRATSPAPRNEEMEIQEV